MSAVDPSVLSPSPDLPRRIGRYAVVRELGRGATAVVYEAVLHGPEGFRKRVALKVLHPEVGERRERRREGLLREARLGALLSHPNVVGTFELGRADGRWYVAMELVRGAPVSDLERLGPLPAATVLDIGLQTAAGLAHIHGLREPGAHTGVVHRDVKPQNLLVDRSGLVKLADLGVARLASSTGRAAGTPGFMPPEQLAGRVEPRSDLFALGAVLYRIATGIAPFGRGRAALERVMDVEAALAEPRFLDRVERRVPGLGPVLHRCLRVDPADRFPSASDLWRALRQLRATVTPGPLAGQLVRRVVPAGLEVTSEPSAPTEVEPLRGFLPRPRDRFVGRLALRSEIEGAVVEGVERLVTLIGPGGVGKTRLALEVAHAVRGRIGGGCWFCDLARATTAVGLATGVAAALGVPLSRDPVGQVQSALVGHGPVLLVLDNLEQLDDEALAVLARWLEVAPELEVLATSRRRLHLPRERVVEVGPLDPVEGAALLRARSPRPLAPEEAGRLGELVDRLGGLPLGLELAAARLRVQRADALLEVLCDPLALPGSSAPGIPRRHRSLAACLEGTWANLDPAARQALGRLEAFVDGASLEQAEAVLDGDEAWPLQRVEALVDWSMLRYDAVADRFRMSAPVRALVQARRSEDETRAAHLRHGRYLELRFASASGLEGCQGPGAPQALAELVRAAPELWAAAERALDRGDVAQGAALARALVPVAERVGPLEPCRELLDRLLGAPDVPLERELRSCRGTILRLLGRVEDARADLERSLELAGREGDPRALIRCRRQLAVVMMYSGEHGRAEALLDAALEHAEGMPVERSLVQQDRGSLRFRQGRYREARACYQEAWRGLAEVPTSRASAAGNLALALAHLGRQGDAEPLLREALAGFRALGDRRRVALWQMNLGMHLAVIGRPEAGSHELREARQGFARLGDRVGESTALTGLGALHRLGGARTEARRCLEAALALRSHHDLPGVATCLTELGVLALDGGDLEEAERLLVQATRRAEASDHGRLLGYVGSELARLRVLQGEVGEAERLLDTAEERLRAGSDHSHLVLAVAHRALARHVAGDDPAAVRLLAEARGLMRRSGFTERSEAGRRVALVGAQIGR